jgi:hypothetical protein
VRDRAQRPPCRSVGPSGDDEIRRDPIVAGPSLEKREVLATVRSERDARLTARAAVARNRRAGGPPPTPAAVRGRVDAKRLQQAVVRRGQQVLRVPRIDRDRRLALDALRTRDVDVDAADRPRVPDRPDAEVVDEEDR